MPPEPESIEIQLLGGFGVAIGAVALAAADWPGLRSAQLVQRLALAEGGCLLREQVIDALWPQLDPEAGAANLRKAAHHARQALRRPDAVVLQGGRVRLFPSARLEVDALRFEHAADAALAAGDPQACAAAAAAYRGELLPDSPYEAWTEATRARLRARHRELLRASAQWERLAELEPTDEPAHRELMRGALAAGNAPAAVRAFFRLRQALETTLGVAPDRATEALYRQCARGLGSPGPAFVGRHAELAQAAAWLDAAPADRPGGLVVRGPGGIGKSAFCARLVALARERGWSAWSLDATQPAAPYAVTAALADRVILEDRGVLERIGGHARAVLATLSALAAPAAALPVAPVRHQVIGALRRLLLAASGGAPALVLVDDAHQLGEADADLLRHLGATGRPVHVALALRPTATADARAPLHGLARALAGGMLAAIDIGPLAERDAAELVARAASLPLDAAVVERVVQRAAGNPFAALELARCAGGDARLPASAREAVAARLCDVDPATRSLLERLALVGDRFDTPAVVALAGHDEGDALATLDRALAAGVLRVDDAGYRFSHELVRQALVEGIAPHRRLKVQRDAAACLATTGAAPAAIAQLWTAGGSPAQAAPWWLEAARGALRLGAFAQALRYLEPLLGFDPKQPEALRLRAEALDALGEPAAVAAYRAAADAVGTVGAPASHDLRAKGALAQIKQGDPKGALEALAGVHPSSVEGRLCEALTYSGAAALGFGDPAIGTAKAAQARRLALNSGDQASIVIASWAQAAAAHARGELHSSVWADLLETQHLPQLAVRVFDGHLCITQRFLYGARPYPQVMAFADALAAEARRLGAARGQAFGVTLRGEAELLAGELDVAEEHLALGGRLHRAIGGAVGEALALQRRAELALHRGQRDRAGGLLDEALDLARQTDIGFHLLDRIYGTRLALAPDPQQALALLEEAQDAVRGPFETCPGCRITFAVPAAIAAARAGELELAERHEQSCTYLAQVVMRLPAWDAALEEVRAHTAQARGDDAASVGGHFAAAARGFRTAGHRLDAARCERLAAEAPHAGTRPRMRLAARAR